MAPIRRPFSGPVINPHDRHVPPGTPFKHGHGPLQDPPSPSGLRRSSGDVGFVSLPAESRIGTPTTTSHPVTSEAHEEQLRQVYRPHHRNRGPRTTTPGQTVAPRVHRGFFRPRGVL